MKYSSTDRPSMKLALIGRSMISPFGSAIRPRMPASWRICLKDPRAPELAIMKIGFSSSSVASIASATVSVPSVQIATIDSCRSDSVISPRSYCASTSPTRASYRARICSLSAGMTMSFFEIVIPAGVERELDLLLGAEPLRMRVVVGGFLRIQVVGAVRQVVEAEDHVLRRRRERLPVGRREDVVRRQHQDPRLGLRLRRQRQVDRH